MKFLFITYIFVLYSLAVANDQVPGDCDRIENGKVVKAECPIPTEDDLKKYEEIKAQIEADRKKGLESCLAKEFPELKAATGFGGAFDQKAHDKLLQDIPKMSHAKSTNLFGCIGYVRMSPDASDDVRTRTDGLSEAALKRSWAQQEKLRSACQSDRSGECRRRVQAFQREFFGEGKRKNAAR